MKRIFGRLSIAAGLLLCGLVVLGCLWVKQYTELIDAEPDVVLAPDIADLTYCTVDGIPLPMDLYFPAQEARRPVLIYLHGGSFTSGDKRKGSGVIDIPAMTARGYAVAAVNYRLMPEHSFPAQVIDAKCAVRFLRAHAAEYNLLTEKIGVWGGSAGGHLAAMMGLTNNDAAYEAGTYLTEVSRVDAVVDMFGPTDLTRPMDWFQRWILRRAFGTDTPQDKRLIEASPVRYVTLEAPPFLLLYGQQDAAVPSEQGQLLYQELQDAGADAELVIVENGNHNFKPTGGPIKPTRAEISDLMADFFDRCLR